MRWLVFTFITHLVVVANGQLDSTSFFAIMQSDTLHIRFDGNCFGDGSTSWPSLDIRIELTNGNWYNVELKDSEGKSIKRVVHKHRIEKFAKKVWTLSRNDCSDWENSPYWNLFLFEAADNATQWYYCSKNNRWSEQLLHILKLWYNIDC